MGKEMLSKWHHSAHKYAYFRSGKQAFGKWDSTPAGSTGADAGNHRKAPVESRDTGRNKAKHSAAVTLRAQELCESRGGRPGLPVPNKPHSLCGRKATLNQQ